MAYRLLIVDDSVTHLGFAKEFLEKNGFVVDTAFNGDQAVEKVRSHGSEYAVVVLDYLMDGKNGAITAQEMRALCPSIYILIYSNDPTRDAMRNTFKAGAMDFLDKAGNQDDLLNAIKLWCQKYEENRKPLSAPPASENSRLISSIGMVGVSDSMASVAKFVLRFRQNQASVLIMGESGTGKELIAKALHFGNRHRFLAVNCASYCGDAALLESELFGIEKDSFTGAHRDKKGIFEEADGGTVFLDEIHTLSLAAQMKILRVLQEKKIRPVGSNEEHDVNFRLVVAAKPNLESLVNQGKFLMDLYYRLNVLTIRVPSLTSRPEDIAPLVHHFCGLYNLEYNDKKVFLAKTVRQLERYPWPGNIRELGHAIEAACLSTSDMTISPEHLDARFKAENSMRPNGPLKAQLDQITRDTLKNAIETSKSQREAAKKLGLAPSSFHDLLRRYGLLERKSG